MKDIRNFSIIAHIDHGKSTLAGRLLELAGTSDRRRINERVFDSMELEQERGITIKMKPVRLCWTLKTSDSARDYVLNLIDTPGHVDFSYEVSRALRAVEGVVLLVDATQGVQAQTLSTCSQAREAGLTIIPAVSKIDSPLARTEEVKREVAELLHISEAAVLEVSGKTGKGVLELLTAIVTQIPPPAEASPGAVGRGLIFDFRYSNHMGVVLYVRVTDGSFKKGERLILLARRAVFSAAEVGLFLPHESPAGELSAGEIGYIVTGIKEPGISLVGDTVTFADAPLSALPGYREPKPVVWAALYPESQNDWNLLRQALLRLRLSDASFTFEEESSGLLGRGFRCGFLGILHLEIVSERLRREFSLRLVVTTPSIAYEVIDRRGPTPPAVSGRRRLIRSPTLFPSHVHLAEVWERWVVLTIITPAGFVGAVGKLLFRHEGRVMSAETFVGGRTLFTAEMPLRELLRGFFDELKSVSSGLASFSYEFENMRPAEVVRLNVLVAGEPVAAFTRIVSRKRLEEEAKAVVEKLYRILPRQLFAAKIQAEALGRIIASRTLPALKKNVTGHLYGGDITRKRKLWEKQKEGKRRLKERGKVNIPPDVFLKMIQPEH